MKNYKSKSGFGKKPSGSKSNGRKFSGPPAGKPSDRPFRKKPDFARDRPEPEARPVRNLLPEADKTENENAFDKPVREKSKGGEGGPAGQWIYGLQTVSEALKRGLSFKKIYLRKRDAGKDEETEGKTDLRPAEKKIIKQDRIEAIIAHCKEEKIQFYFAEPDFFYSRFPEKNHQWVAAELKGGSRIVPDLAALIEAIPAGRTPLILMLDRVTDQQNLGAITRSAYFFGCDAVVMENHHAAPVDETVHRVSSGASLLIPFYTCEKLSQAVEILKSKGFKIFGTVSHDEPAKGEPASEDANTQTTQDAGDESKKFPLVELGKASFQGPSAIFLGSEGTGLRPHLVRMCDELIWIRGYLGFDSLNVGSAGAVLLYEARRQLGV